MYIKKDIWIIANFKSHKNIAEALDWVSVVGPQIEKRDNLKVVVCPPFEDLSEVKTAIQAGGFNLLLGSQDLSPFAEGAFTGEEPATLLDDLITLAILGHSERRQNFNETDQMVEKKVDQALKSHIIPLVCVQGLETPVPKECNLIAYEPIFAIGTGTPDTPQNAQKVAEEFRKKYGEALKVLYGGSVTSENSNEFLKQEHISGLLIGKASLDAEEFAKIVSQASLL